MTSSILVALQFIFMALILWPWAGSDAHLSALGLATVAGLLALWTLFHNRPGNFNVRPEVCEGASLITTGPYRYIRNPMYTALLMLMLAIAIYHGRPYNMIMWVLLAIVLAMKVRLEEGHLADCFPEYEAYKTRVKRFIPWLF